ncbi:3-dehydroquinate synthase [Roseospirillum parvum]|uniref:3-dehydroquinate synthase n=1 Tax=Roseospirillum parvum TaxID=83401 RepID=A0A1G8D680_9PROT|nr:3-dehydroquinate synthase [Roseospirillum parvum]SDH53181.1 3-dehydroquinate synthase [Roseospirillum parvum]
MDAPSTPPGIDRLDLDLGPRSYPILVGDGLIERAGALLRDRLPARRAFVITDENVAPIHLNPLLKSLQAGGIEAPHLILKAGESTKCLAVLEEVLETLIAVRTERSTTLIALGGGVIGDLTGFAAAVLLRGVPFVQIPTTLLAQVDSSVGGKTGINSRTGKNLIGAFHQPRAVLADTHTLDTLPRRDLLAGYAEVVKTALIGDAPFFAWLEANGQALLDGDGAARRHAVLTSCATKARVVAADEREAGQRALLNLGHTFGHALEAEAGFDSGLRHGEAVAIGLVMAYDTSVRRGLCPPQAAERVRAHLKSVGLPTRPGDIPGIDWPGADDLARHVAFDKKVKDGRPTFVLARDIGDTFLSQDLTPADIETAFAG